MTNCLFCKKSEECVALPNAPLMRLNNLGHCTNFVKNENVPTWQLTHNSEANAIQRQLTELRQVMDNTAMDVTDLKNMVQDISRFVKRPT